MREFFRKSRFVLMIVLAAQSVSLFFLFLSQLGKRKSLAEAFLAVSACEAVGSGFLFARFLADHKEKILSAEQQKAMEEDPEGFEIPLDKTASEKEFR